MSDTPPPPGDRHTAPSRGPGSEDAQEDANVPPSAAEPIPEPGGASTEPASGEPEQQPPSPSPPPEGFELL